VESPLESFMVDLKDFIDFLVKDEQIGPFTEKMMFKTQAAYERYDKQLETEKETAIQLRDLFVENYPDLDDTDRERQHLTDMEYEYTFHYFNRVLREPGFRIHRPLVKEPLDDYTDVYELIQVLRTKSATAAAA
jgi:hypothetical protein